MTSTSSRNLHRGTLAATFTSPPPACATLALITGHATSTGFWGQKCAEARDREAEGIDWYRSCYPWYSSAFQDGFYSPASNCPSGWTPVASRTTAMSALDASFLDGETAVICCPSGMTYLLNDVSSELNGHCRPPKTINTTYIVQQCTGGTAGLKPETWRYTGQPTYIITAEALELRYQPLIRYESVPTATAPTNTSTSAPVPENVYMRNGIITGCFVSITILGLCGAIFFVYRRLKRRRGSKTNNEDATPPEAMAEAASTLQDNDPTIPIPTSSLLRLAAMRARGHNHTIRWLQRQAAASSTTSTSQPGPRVARPPSVSDLESWAPASGGPGTVSPIAESSDYLPLGSKARAIIAGVSIADTSRARDVEVGEAAASSKSQNESWAAFQARRARIDKEIGRP